MLRRSFCVVADVACQTQFSRGALGDSEHCEFRPRGFSITQSPDHEITRFLTYSLLIPCFCACLSRKPAIHAAFCKSPKKFPVIFPVIRKFAGSRSRQ